MDEQNYQKLLTYLKNPKDTEEEEYRNGHHNLKKNTTISIKKNIE